MQQSDYSGTIDILVLLLKTNEVELILQDSALLLKPSKPPHQGWFDNYNPTKDVEPLSKMKDLDSEQGDWEWRGN